MPLAVRGACFLALHHRPRVCLAATALLAFLTEVADRDSPNVRVAVRKIIFFNLHDGYLCVTAGNYFLDFFLPLLSGPCFTFLPG